MLEAELTHWKKQLEYYRERYYVSDLVLTILFVGNLTTTPYRSIPSQTDNSPWITSIGERVHPHGVAVSRDLLKRWGGPLDYGDTLYIEDIGFKVVNDCMHERHKQHIDVWVYTYKDEKAFDNKFKGKKLKVWIVKRKQ